MVGYGEVNGASGQSARRAYLRFRLPHPRRLDRLAPSVYTKALFGVEKECGKGIS